MIADSAPVPNWVSRLNGAREFVNRVPGSLDALRGAVETD
jgi:hypothetical protein